MAYDILNKVLINILSKNESFLDWSNPVHPGSSSHTLSMRRMSLMGNLMAQDEAEGGRKPNLFGKIPVVYVEQ